MKRRVDLIVHSAKELLTCHADKPKRRAEMQDTGLIPDGAVAIQGESIVAVGPTNEIISRFETAHSIDASGKVVCPAWVDPHTHTIYAGDRVGEFEMKLKGVPYLDILAQGGGIVSTMRATRQAALEELIEQTEARLDAMLLLGTGTVEIKTGYGLSTEEELKLLRGIELLASRHPMDIVPTFLGAHAIPPEFKGKADDYVKLLVDETIPDVANWYSTSWFKTHRPKTPFFIDVFCERNAFDRHQMLQLLKAGVSHGMKVKAHVDQFTSLGGLNAALEMQATSVDHLENTTDEDIARLAASETLGVVIPFANFNMGMSHYAPARKMLNQGVALALCSDLNPGSAPCYSMPLVMGIACRMMKLSCAEAVNASTINAAHAIGYGERIGSLAAGKQADILILSVPDYRHVVYYQGSNPVERIIKRGRWVKRDEL